MVCVFGFGKRFGFAVVVWLCALMCGCKLMVGFAFYGLLVTERFGLYGVDLHASCLVWWFWA